MHKSLETSSRAVADNRIHNGYSDELAVQFSYWPMFLQTAACGGISPPLSFFPPPVYSRPRVPLFSVFTLRSFGGASIILHSSSILY